MENSLLAEMTDEQLLLEKKKMQKSKMLNALVIGFLGGVVGVGLVAAFKSKNFVIIIPMLFPIYFMYKMLTKPNKHAELEALLKERGL
ncbi:hypothetical protein [Marivirga atlantica]|jgi:uncharacterized membrane protein YfcA|uniref:FUSC family protein n=1 Tax=Marivirga atlantica TaxID=1548457 RepID=A0A937AFP4_9BACT|nr:hypothetical protein [Marivirga atlantica]MBL0764739.1 hypothetical protein [Marivirga atlantica]